MEVACFHLNVVYCFKTNMETRSNDHLVTAKPSCVISKISQQLSKMLSLVKRHTLYAIFPFSNTEHQRTTHGSRSTLRLIHCKTLFLLEQ